MTIGELVTVSIYSVDKYGDVVSDAELDVEVVLDTSTFYQDNVTLGGGTVQVRGGVGEQQVGGDDAALEAIVDAFSVHRIHKTSGITDRHPTNAMARL